MDLPLLRRWRESRFQNCSDAVLCAECLAGSEEAWGALLGRYQNLIYAIPLRFHFTEEEAADIFQAVAIDLFTGLDRVKDKEKLKSWLISVTRHRCMRYKERRKVEPISWEELEAGGASDVADEHRQAEEWLLDLTEESLLRESVAALPARCQELVRWLFYSDEPPSYVEVAGRLGVAKNSIGFIRDRCLQKLRKHLEENGFGKR